MAAILERGRLLKAKVRERLFGSLAERLLELGCVDVGESDFDLMPADEHGDGVAIVHADNAARDLRGRDGARRKLEKGGKRKCSASH
jgi:hypothetical protein